jgi:hypothetical protein
MDMKSKIYQLEYHNTEFKGEQADLMNSPTNRSSGKQFQQQHIVAYVLYMEAHLSALSNHQSGSHSPFRYQASE